MSPSSDWNVYVMDAYRQVNMREETAFTQLPFEFNTKQNKLSVKTSLDLTPIVQPETDAANWYRSDHPNKGRE